MQIDISHIPQQPWVYLFKDSKGTILYIWKAKNLQKRVSQYFTPNSLWKQEMVAKASKVDFFVVANESESLYLENNLIKKHKPFFNCMLKWWNGYTYIKFSDSDFPQVLTTRNKKNDKATYIWPKHNTKELNIVHVQILSSKNEKFVQISISDYVVDGARNAKINLNYHN